MEIATCLACQNRVEIEDWCLYKPETIGCNDKASNSTSLIPPLEECCDLPISKCIACKERVTEKEFCLYRSNDYYLDQTDHYCLETTDMDVDPNADDFEFQCYAAA